MGHYMLRSGQAMEKVSLKGLELSLLASGDGTEVIHHRLAPGRRWAMSPEKGWNALEFMLVLSGTLVWERTDGAVVLTVGDSVQDCPVDEEQLFVAETEVEFLYVSSRPLFHQYSRQALEFRELAVAVEQKDGYTADHCDRINRLAMRIGQRMGLTTTELVHLSLGAYFHDIGKVDVPDTILGKPGPLTDAEWVIMKKHPTFGRMILESTGLPFFQTIGLLVEQHHERWDGEGYPHKLQGEQILLTAAIISVVDAFDAMTTDRPYHARMTREEGVAELVRGKGTQFHPDVVDAFLAILQEQEEI